MFAQHPVVPRDEERPRIVVLGRPRRKRQGKSDGSSALELLVRRTKRRLEDLFPGSKLMCFLPHCPPLAELRELIDAQQFNVLVVEDLTALGEHPRLRWSLIDWLFDAGVRFVSLDDRFDTGAAVR